MDAQTTPTRSAGSRLGAMLGSQLRNIAPFITLIALLVFFGVASPSFLSVDNFSNILNQVSVTAIMAVGLTFVILCAEIDLSVAAIANAAGIVVAFFTVQEAYVNIANVPLPGWAAILVALASCAALGLVNAFGVTRIGIPSFIMTLAMMQIGAGICAMLVRGQIAYAVPPILVTLGSGSIGGIPWIVIVAGITLLVAHLVLTYTRFGRYVYMVGGNREAAEFSGVNVRVVIGAVMVISAVCSGLAGMLGVALFRQRPAERVRHLPARRHRRGGGRRHQPVRRPRRHRQHHHRRADPGRAEQRPGPCRHRQLPEDPDPRPDPAGSPGDQRLCPAPADGARRCFRLTAAHRSLSRGRPAPLRRGRCTSR
ncbi:ribose/xylose/arabinose/galactoside ABC-type transport system permease subunit [Inquilinus ginsengisoli]|uniref:ABC transporter permease n=1 Tax=Inquilinus ginsengisoli TaxID=363840 RepID=UPI003D228669